MNLQNIFVSINLKIMSKFEQCTRCKLDFINCGYYDHNSDEHCNYFVHPIDNSRMFSRWYKFSGRIGRLEYVLTLVAAIVLYFFVVLLVGKIMEIKGWNLETQGELYLFSFGCLIPSAYLAIAAGVKRAHDSEVSPWYALTPLIPVVLLNVITFILFCAGFVFLFKDKGVDGINEHGSNPVRPYNDQLLFD